VTLVLYHNSY